MTIFDHIQTRKPSTMDIRIDPGWLGWIWGVAVAIVSGLVAAVVFIWRVASGYGQAIEGYKGLEKRLEATNARVAAGELAQDAFQQATTEQIDRLGDRFERRFDSLDARIDKAIARG